ncbi:MAG: PDZ domain-containing protein [Bacteroidales bacterium]|nr:PDZ domain-containing protein [Bacteroidales bacterium]
MRRLNPWLHILIGCLLAITLFSCTEKVKTEEERQKEQLERTRTGVSYFGANCMSLYYLWTEEISPELSSWLSRDQTTDPIKKVQAIRYKQGGKDYDRWTEMTDDFEAFSSSVEGISTTYGCDITLMQVGASSVQAVITVVYAGSPAAQAGLKRGDIIARIDDKEMTTLNYYKLVTDQFLYSPECRLGLLDPDTGKPDREVTMTAVTMYEDPVVYHSVFQIGGKKVGYLVYTAFTLRSIDALLAVCEEFKSAGISELILDLRYNSGGYVTTEEALASMLAPKEAVRSGALFEQEIYNGALTQFFIKEYGSDALKTFFKTDFSWEDGVIPSSCNTRSGHLDLDKIYAIIDSGTASASESILVGLMPYMDITLIGGQSHGKFCTGIMYGAEEWYNDYKDDLGSDLFAYRKEVKNWGLYVMIGRYADRNGNCPAMPDGLKPDYAAEDRPDLGYDFGDERDPMLQQALILAGRTDLIAAVATRSASPGPDKMPLQVRRPEFGKRIQKRPAAVR